MKRPILLLLCVVWLAPGASAHDPSPDVPLSHPVYATLDRFEARGWFARPVPGHHPLSRRGVARLLQQVLRKIGSGASLSRTERGIVDRHRAEFAAEIARLGSPRDVPRSGRGSVDRVRQGRNFITWQDSVAHVALNPLLHQRLLVFRGGARPEETVSQTYVGAIVRGTYHDRLGFRVRHFEAREWSTRARGTREDVVARPIGEVQLKGKTVDFREATFQLIWSTPWFRLDAGKAVLDWGPGRTGNLLLTRSCPPFGVVRFRVAYGRVSYVHVVGVLRARPGLIESSRTRVDNGHVRTFLRAKHLAAHRLEVALGKGLSLGLQEAVVYGDRSPELLYINPATVLTATQTYLGDNDNVVIGLDLSARPVRNLQAYAAFFFDDMMKFSPSAAANKYALQLGFLWVDPFRLPDTDLRVEYVRVEPFVYSHKFDINTYEHFDALLGYPLGPNSDRVHGRFVHRFSPSLSFGLTVERDREGENVLQPDGSLVNVGGNAQLGRGPSDTPSRDFMAGKVEARTRLGLNLDYEPIRDLFFRAAYQWTSASNALLPTAGRGDGRARFLNVAAEYNFP